jgi:alkaline phosphatase D
MGGLVSSSSMSISRRTFTRSLSAAGFAAALGRTAQAQSAGVFRHGIASGDPLINRVMIWTRVTPTVDEAVIPVEWLMAEDPRLTRVIQRGLTYTNVAFDYTVKVDVTRLNPNTTYYYQFSYKGTNSPVGRTQTLPLGSVERLRFGVVSCSNLPYGFFNSYRLLANRADLNFVLHLGDYIYEYANAQFGNGTAIGRVPAPDKEILTLADYRARYAQYRSDPDLQEAHRQHPFIVVWDDHETANDAWTGGAENHQPETEGDWSVRRAVAAQAWSEWMPVRPDPYLGGEIYRTFRFGDLMDLVMLDTRLSGREKQLAPTSPALLDPNRQLMGAEQESWVYRELSLSQARATRWRVIGQQVMMGQLFNTDGTPFNPDQWDGYPAARSRLLGYIGQNSINNVVVLTGDIHSSWGNEIAANPFVPSYVSQAVEFVGPAVTSPGIDDRVQATALQGQIGATHPHVKYVELFRRGYLLIDIDRDRVQGEWYHLTTITERSTGEEFARALRTASGEAKLTAANEPSRPASNPAPLAP